MHKVDPPPGKRPQLVRFVDVFRLVGFGWYFGGCVVGGVAAGYFVDKWLGTKPLFILIGLLLGTAAGFYGMYKMLWPIYRADRIEKDK